MVLSLPLSPALPAHLRSPHFGSERSCWTRFKGFGPCFACLPSICPRTICKFLLLRGWTKCCLIWQRDGRPRFFYCASIKSTIVRWEGWHEGGGGGRGEEGKWLRRHVGRNGATYAPMSTRNSSRPSHFEVWLRTVSVRSDLREDDISCKKLEAYCFVCANTFFLYTYRPLSQGKSLRYVHRFSALIWSSVLASSVSIDMFIARIVCIGDIKIIETLWSPTIKKWTKDGNMEANYDIQSHIERRTSDWAIL